MASFVKVNNFVEDVASGVHDLSTGTSHVFKVMLCTAVPGDPSVRANWTETASGNGYTTGGISVGTITGAQASGTFKMVGGTDPVWTSTGTLNPGRYAVLYNDTPTSPADPVIGYWDYGSVPAALATGETHTVDLDQTNGILTLA
jgi:hypothetical protein